MTGRVDRFIQFEPLGMRRNLVLDCLGGHTRQAPGFLEPVVGADIFAAFRHHVDELSQQAAFQADPLTALLLATGRLLTGDLAAADFILDHLPTQAPKLRFGQRHCPLMPFRTLGAALPLPPELADTDRWLDGSPEQEALRTWLATNRDALRWIEAEGAYAFAAEVG